MSTRLKGPCDDGKEHVWRHNPLFMKRMCLRCRCVEGDP